MNTRILASLILASFAGSALALPGNEQPPLTEALHKQRHPLLKVSSHSPQPFAMPTAHADTALAKGQTHGKRKQHG